MASEYEPLSVIFKLKPDRILDIALAEEADRKRRLPLIRALQVNDRVKTFLENPYYRIKDGGLIWDDKTRLNSGFSPLS
jgi:hypothetical protein